MPTSGWASCRACLLAIVWTGGAVPAGEDALLAPSRGQLPGDTGSDGLTRLEIVECPELGGQALKVSFHEGDSFGDRAARVASWKAFRSLRFDAFLPGKEGARLTLTIHHGRTKGYPTRVDVPIDLVPGKNAVAIPLDRLRNVDGSAPDLGSVGRWYIACEAGKAPTVLVGDILLVTRGTESASPGGPAEATAPAGGAPAGKVRTDPVRLQRIRAAKMPRIARPVQFHTPEADAICAALEVFPPDNPWNQLVDEWPVHPRSDAIIRSIGPEKPLRCNPDMGFVLVPPDQPRVPVKLVEYPGESDPGPYPVPDEIPIEGWPGWFDPSGGGKSPDLLEVQRATGGDRHGIVVDPVNRKLWEFFVLRRADGGWEAAQASAFDLASNALRPDGWTSADAAGLPIFPSVVRHDEIRRGVIDHAMRVTVRKTRRAYVAPATHFASPHEDPDYPRMGERIRLKAACDVSRFSPAVRVVLEGLKRYGMLVADNGIEWAISVAPDPRIPSLHEELRRVKGSDFEVVVPPE